MRPTGSGRLAMSDVGCTALWTAFVIGPDQIVTEGSRQKRTTGGFGPHRSVPHPRRDWGLSVD